MEKSITFIHCADLHLDSPFTGMHEYSRDRRGDLRKTFESIISLTMEEKADYLLISGDLYEQEYSGRTTIRWLNDRFAGIADKHVLIIPGNHDPYVDNSWYKNYKWSTNVHILSSNNPDFRDEEKGCYFYGIGFDSYRQEKISLKKEPQILPEYINICLFHGTVDMAFSEQAYNPAGSKELFDLGFDYYALGHFHKRGETFADKGMINPGSPEPLGFDELKDHGVYTVRLSKYDGKARRDYKFVRLQQREYKDLNLDVTGVEDESRLMEKLSKTLEQQASKEDIIRINLVGGLNRDVLINTKELEQFFTDKYYYLKIKDCTRPDYNINELALEKSITGVFVKMMLDKISNAGDDEKPVFEKALYLGLEALMTEDVKLQEWGVYENNKVGY